MVARAAVLSERGGLERPRRIRIGGPELSWWAGWTAVVEFEVGGDEPLMAVVCGSEGGTRYPCEWRRRSDG